MVSKPTFTEPTQSEPTLSESDIRYVLAEYRTLGQLCEGRAQSVAEVQALISGGRLPQATYVLPSGEARFPPDYFALVDEAGGVDALPARFRARYLAASATSPSADADADEDWAGYLTGQFGVCLRSVTPESMAEKNRLIRRIEALVETPAGGDVAWREQLRATVDALDEIERPFTDFDRQRWADTSRGRHIDRMRERYPAAFGKAFEGRESMV
ncbi:MAG: hypothetical protein GEV28_08390 [Actinophytocola sp.]|uniref:DUF6058 family natural product biosynthesis protein n=1 Tax=Actinophytocola sp. TaxID=1872138 RepID=UPI00132A9AEF|nr:DUF6058 family natural product biosynthesis protein [Actinophytocola sp.]MPZ80397.1 hypothetical protein [Actinophytocola sp.]